MEPNHYESPAGEQRRRRRSQLIFDQWPMYLLLVILAVAVPCFTAWFLVVPLVTTLE